MNRCEQQIQFFVKVFGAGETARTSRLTYITANRDCSLDSMATSLKTLRSVYSWITPNRKGA
jgi:hypothetical protein